MKCENCVYVCLVIQVMFAGQSDAGWSSGLSLFQAALNKVSSNFPIVSSLTSGMASAAGSLASSLAEAYDENVKFFVSSNSFTSNEWFHTGDSLSSMGCDVNGKFTFVVHGWRGFIDTWVDDLVANFIKHRGGCVIAINWNYYARNPTYPYVVANTLPEVAHLLRRKLDDMVNNEGISPDNIHLFGHSLGARMVLEAGMKFGTQRLASVDACDPAGPSYGSYDNKPENNFRNAAKNVQCIHTSSNFGTATRHCHQDWEMGKCGKSQPGANDLLYACQTVKVCSKGENEAASNSHNRCYQFYNSAFTHNFFPDILNACPNVLDIRGLPAGTKMGYMEKRDNPVYGVMASSTSASFPFNMNPNPYGGGSPGMGP